MKYSINVYKIIKYGIYCKTVIQSVNLNNYINLYNILITSIN